MLSFHKTFTAFPLQIPITSQHRLIHSLTIRPIRSSSENDNNTPTTTTTSSDDSTTPTPLQPPVTPPDTVEIRFRRGSRKRRKQQDDENFSPKKSPPKDWDSMTYGEKAMELYVGEKGLLFWLNKFAYASIFIIIGGWIVFRFVGPALNLYQLDTPPLSPTAILKG